MVKLKVFILILFETIKWKISLYGLISVKVKFRVSDSYPWSEKSDCSFTAVAFNFWFASTSKEK